MMAVTDFDRLVTKWLEGAGPETLRAEGLDSALEVARRTSRRSGIRAFLVGPAPWPHRRRLAFDAFPPVLRIAVVASLLAGLLIAGALTLGRRTTPPPEPVRPPARQVLPTETRRPSDSPDVMRGLSKLPAGCAPSDVTSPTVLGDGRVLGFSDNKRTTICDYDTATVVDGPRLSVERHQPDTVLLADGRVLVIGGELSEGDHGTVAGATAEVVDPHAATTSPAIPLVEPRWAMANALLPDGRVLLAGGIDIASDDPLTSAEVFDPETMTFSPTGSMLEPRLGDLAVLPDGRVVATGDQFGGAALSTTEVWDPATGSFSMGDPLDPIVENPDDSPYPLGARSPVVALAGGEVLVPGLACQEVHGYRADGLSDGVRETPIERWNPATNTFSRTGSMPHCVHTAIPLPDGRLYVRGWWYVRGDGDDFSDQAWAGVYDPTTGDIRSLGAPRGAQAYLRILAFPDGRIARFGTTMITHVPD
jgi:hypothetical protein